MDSNHTFVGRSGDEDPLITIPMKDMTHFYVDGTIQDWKIAKAVWRTAFAQLEVTAKHPRGLTFTIPSCATRSDLRKIVDAMFSELPISSVLLTNVWIPVLISYNLVTGVVVHIGHTETVIISVVCFSVSDACIVRLPFGIKDARLYITAIVDVCTFF